MAHISNATIQEMKNIIFQLYTLAFCKASQDHITYLSWLLMLFKAISGLRITLDKSELIPIGCVDNLDDLALELGCKVDIVPSSYLGLPLGPPFKPVAT